MLIESYSHCFKNEVMPATNYLSRDLSHLLTFLEKSVCYVALNVATNVVFNIFLLNYIQTVFGKQSHANKKLF